MIPSIHDLTAQSQAEHVALNGGYNDFPPNWHEITETEYAKSRHFTFHPTMYEFRQMITRDESGTIQKMTGATLWWQSEGTGYTEVIDFWAGTVRYFKFGERPADLVENFDTSD